MTGNGEDGKRTGKSPFIRMISIILAVSAIASVALFFYDLNGDSMDFSDREIRQVVTDSMDGEPTEYEISTIPVDSLVMVHRLSPDRIKDLKVGDVIAFHQDGIMKTHRVVSIDPDAERIVTKGDSNSSNDAEIGFSDVHGKVTGVSPAVGKVIGTVKGMFQSMWVVLAIVIIVLITMIFAIIEIIGIIREE